MKKNMSPTKRIKGSRRLDIFIQEMIQLKPLMDNTPKKILFVITKSNWGGAQRYVYDLATSLDRKLFDPEVVLGGNGLLKEKLELAGIPVTSLSSMERDINLKKEFLSMKELWKLLRAKKPDILHLNSSKAGGLGALVARFAGVKRIVFTAHAWAFNENREFVSKMIISFLHWFTVLLTHQTIAVSEAVKEQVVHMPFMKNKIKVIHLGVRPSEYKTKEEARAFFKDSSEGLWVGIIAELHPVKGLLYAIDAIALIIEKNPDVRLFIIGEGDQRPIIEKQIAKRRLGEVVHLVGFVDNAKIYMKAFDIFMLPSISEAFGYTLLEAGLAEVPVIATSVGGIVEVIDESGILVPSKNAKALSEALLKLINSEDLRHQLGTSLNERVQNVFSIKKMCEETLDVYTIKG